MIKYKFNINYLEEEVFIIIIAYYQFNLCKYLIYFNYFIIKIFYKFLLYFMRLSKNCFGKFTLKQGFRFILYLDIIRIVWGMHIYLLIIFN